MISYFKFKITYLMERKKWKIFANSLEKSHTSNRKKSTSKYKPKVLLNKSNDSFLFSRDHSTFSKLNSSFNNNETTFPTFARNSSLSKLAPHKKEDDSNYLKPVQKKEKEQCKEVKKSTGTISDKIMMKRNERALADLEKLKVELK